MTNMLAASKFVAARFPGCDLAILAGSTARNEETATSDLDIVVIMPDLSSCYRESFFEFTWPIEVFIHTKESCLSWIEKDLKRRKPSLAQMFVEGVLIAGSADLLRELKEYSQSRLLQGPEKYSKEEDLETRYRITDLLDDLIGANQYLEQIFIINELLDLVLNYELINQGKWVVHNKRIPKGIKLLGLELSTIFNDAVTDFYQNKRKASIVNLVSKILDMHGGKIFDGYSQGKIG